ncbi:hypothetical protein TNCV_1783871 [Trichonephila clavipes]|nr:hypothetical protein TNCV_1783871 [Trichonephila clavipes]
MPTVLNSVCATSGPEVHVQMFRSGVQSDLKPPVLSYQASLVVINRSIEGVKAESILPGRGLNLELVAWKRDALTTQTQSLRWHLAN